MFEDLFESPLWLLCGYLFFISMMAIGGGVIVLAPEIHRYVVDTHHWITSEQFTASFTLAQAAPGPNLLFVTLVGWHVGGVIGAVGATIAIIVPPSLLTILVMRFSGNGTQGPWRAAIRTGLAPISVGLMLSMGWLLVRTADTNWGTAILTILTVVVMMTTRMNPLWLIVLGAAAGLLGWA